MDVKKIRNSLNLTQEELAKRIGVSRNTIVNYEKGGVIPDSKSEILSKLAEEGEMLKQPQIESDAVLIQNPEIMMVRSRGSKGRFDGRWKCRIYYGG